MCKLVYLRQLFPTRGEKLTQETRGIIYYFSLITSPSAIAYFCEANFGGCQNLKIISVHVYCLKHLYSMELLYFCDFWLSGKQNRLKCNKIAAFLIKLFDCSVLLCQKDLNKKLIHDY